MYRPNAKPSSTSLDAYAKARRQAANNRSSLVSQASLLAQEIERVLEDWVQENDAITGKPLVTIEPIEDAAWGRLIKLSNGHFLEFLVTDNGKLRVRTTVPHGEHQMSRAVYDSIAPAAQGASGVTLWSASNGIPARSVIDTFIEDGVKMQDVDAD